MRKQQDEYLAKTTTTFNENATGSKEKQSLVNTIILFARQKNNG